MKFLHAADLHLDSPMEGLERYEGAPVDLIRGATRRALENLVELALREQVDFVLIAGDLYDGDWRDFNTGMFFIRQMNRLHDAGIPFYVIAGNHDAASNMTRKLRLPLNPDGLSVMLSSEFAETRRIDELGVAVHGRSFAVPAETKNLVPDYPIAVGQWFNIGLLHTSLNGSEDHDAYAPCTTADLRSKGYDYWALGHIHKRSLLPAEGVPFGLPVALYSGNIQGRHLRETGPRGCFLVSVDSHHRVAVEFRPLDVFRWELCVVSCAGLLSADEILQRTREELHTILASRDGRTMGIRVILEGATEGHQELVSHRTRIVAEIRSIATIESDGMAWIEQVKILTSTLRKAEVFSAAEGPLGELERYLNQIADQPEMAEVFLNELKELARKLPDELMQPPDGLLLENVDWVREIIRGLQPMLLDRLQS